ncbi:MAG: type II secretion system protein [Verrucomicrobiota bacterium]|nr:type II secretion system protein [Verrucomicrobiota bacterium]
MKISRARSCAAFTIIEIMVAIGIFSMVIAAIYSSWTAILRGSRSGLSAAADVQRTRVALRALEEALGSAILYADNSKYYSFFADTSGETAALSFVARLPASFPGSGLFQGQSLRRVSFYVENGQFMLAQSPVLEATELLGKPYTIVLSTNTRVFAAEFYDIRTNDWSAEWLYTNQVPKLMRVAVGFGSAQATAQQVASQTTMRTIEIAGTAISRAGAGQAQRTAGGTRGGARNRRSNMQGQDYQPGGLDDPGAIGSGQGWNTPMPSGLQQGFGRNRERGNAPRSRNSVFPGGNR